MRSNNFNNFPDLRIINCIYRSVWCCIYGKMFIVNCGCIFVFLFLMIFRIFIFVSFFCGIKGEWQRQTYVCRCQYVCTYVYIANTGNRFNGIRSKYIEFWLGGFNCNANEIRCDSSSFFNCVWEPILYIVDT